MELIKLLTSHPKYRVTLKFDKRSNCVNILVTYTITRSTDGIQSDDVKSKFAGSSKLAISIVIPMIAIETSIIPDEMVLSEIEWAIEEINLARIDRESTNGN